MDLTKSYYDSVADGKSAIRWLRAHANEFQIDTNRIVAIGDSAGAHLALVAAIVNGFDEPREELSVSSRPNALFLTSAVVATVPYEGQQLTVEQKMFATFLGPRAKEISPIHHLTANLSPMLLLHGKADKLVPFSEVEKFCVQSKDLGNRCEVVGFDSAPHNLNPTHGDEIAARLERFLKELRYID